MGSNRPAKNHIGFEQELRSNSCLNCMQFLAPLLCEAQAEVTTTSLDSKQELWGKPHASQKGKSHCISVQITCQFFAVQFEPIHFVWTRIAPQKGIGAFAGVHVKMQSIGTDIGANPDLNSPIPVNTGQEPRGPVVTKANTYREQKT